jgi:hypothetical protein
MTINSRIRRRFVTLAAVAGLACVGAATAGSAAAAVTSASGYGATATAWGFECNSTSHFVRERWPTILVRTATFQAVYVKVHLLRWNGSVWVKVQESPWYRGESNNFDRKYYAWTTSIYSAPIEGPVFTYLQPGYYATAEEYYAEGHYWWTNAAAYGSSIQKWCQI